MSIKIWLVLPGHKTIIEGIQARQFLCEAKCERGFEFVVAMQMHPPDILGMQVISAIPLCTKPSGSIKFPPVTQNAPLKFWLWGSCSTLRG